MSTYGTFLKRITKALIRLRGCAGWSAPVLFANPRRQVFSRRGPYVKCMSISQVKIEALNDSRLIGLCLYNVIVLSAVALTLNLALEHRVGLVYGITSGILIIGTTLTQLVVFIPKAGIFMYYGILKDPIYPDYLYAALLSSQNYMFMVTSEINNHNSYMTKHSLPYDFHTSNFIYLTLTEIKGLGMPYAIMMH